ncbi:MAG TPA: MarR family winged helix-turn-helix transcriptional regulator [Beijerinckiaceae bacterium]|jgi:DNA-binding MarR family transcriptional regulator|nr:MarR family winged helix-turn-helix transcriptional regulator [Beijerinckiaceae bacterium]
MYARTRSLGFVVNQAARLMHKVMRAQLDMKGMQPAFVPVLLWLSESDGLTQMELSRLAAVEQGSMAEIVKRMESEGFIERRQDKSDGRKQTLHLTVRAKRLNPKVKDWLDANNASLAVGVSEKDLDTCFDVLGQIIGNLEAQLPTDAGKAKTARRRRASSAD